MKKTPILLSTAALTINSLGAVVPVVAANTERTVSINNLLSDDPISGSSVSLLSAGTSRDVIFLNPEDQNPFFHLLSIDYKNNQMGIQVYEQDDWVIKRIIVAYRDYESGVTEDEADQQLSKLGVEDGAIWKTVWDYDANGVSDLYRYVTPKEDNKPVSLAENLTDIVYYAIEYGHKTGAEWQDNWWTRGKINYRDCTHSSIFDPETMICTEGDKGSYKVRMADYTEVEMPTEEIIAWDEEWNAILHKRYEDTRDELIGLRKYLYNVVKILDDTDFALDNLSITLPKTEGMEDYDEIMPEVTRLQELSRALREYYASLGSSGDTAELENLKQERDELKLEKEALESVKGQLDQENAELRQQIALLESADDRGLVESEVRQEKVEELTATTETKFVVIERENNDDMGSKGSNSKDMAENVDIDGDMNDVADTMEVPNLGDLEEGVKLNLWWILAAGVGLIAGIGLSLGCFKGSKSRK